jgi:hypothetical protein
MVCALEWRDDDHNGCRHGIRLLDPRQYLAASYGAMAMRLSRIKETFSEATVDPSPLVTATEDLLQSEHAASRWAEQSKRLPSLNRTIPNRSLGSHRILDPSQCELRGGQDDHAR